jgi:hypothetical protein
MDLNIQKTNVISFTCKNNRIRCNYDVGDVLNTDWAKDLGVEVDSKL